MGPTTLPICAGVFVDPECLGAARGRKVRTPTEIDERPATVGGRQGTVRHLVRDQLDLEEIKIVLYKTCPSL